MNREQEKEERNKEAKGERTKMNGRREKNTTSFKRIHKYTKIASEDNVEYMNAFIDIEIQHNLTVQH